MFELKSHFDLLVLAWAQGLNVSICVRPSDSAYNEQYYHDNKPPCYEVDYDDGSDPLPSDNDDPSDFENKPYDPKDPAAPEFPNF